METLIDEKMMKCVTFLSNPTFAPVTEFQILDIFYAVLGVFLFRFRNPNKYLINIISILMFSVFMTGFLFFYFGELVGLIGCGISGGCLVISFLLRTYQNGFRTGIDYAKCIAIIAVALYPINFFTYDFFIQENYILIAIGYLILPAAAVIYFYDRYILKPEKMKKRFIIVLIVQTIVIAIAFLYAFIQQTKAVAAQSQAERNLELAQENEKRAIKSLIMQEKLEIKIDSIQKAIGKINK